MCQPYSCLITSDLRLIEGQTIATHSHTLIMRQHGIRAELSVNQYAKVELVPVKDGNYGSDVSTWKLILDEERKPEWWDANLPEITGRVQDAAETWKQKLLRMESYSVDEGELLVCFGNMKPLLSVTGGEVRTWGNSQPTIQSVTGGVVSTWGNSQPTIQSVTGGVVSTWDNSQPTIQSVTGGVVRTWGNKLPIIVEDKR